MHEYQTSHHELSWDVERPQRLLLSQKSQDVCVPWLRLSSSDSEAQRAAEAHDRNDSHDSGCHSGMTFADDGDGDDVDNADQASLRP